MGMEARAPAQTGWEALPDFQAHALIRRQLLESAEERTICAGALACWSPAPHWARDQSRPAELSLLVIQNSSSFPGEELLVSQAVFPHLDSQTGCNRQDTSAEDTSNIPFQPYFSTWSIFQTVIFFFFFF